MDDRKTGWNDGMTEVDNSKLNHEDNMAYRAGSMYRSLLEIGRRYE